MHNTKSSFTGKNALSEISLFPESQYPRNADFQVWQLEWCREHKVVVLGEFKHAHSHKFSPIHQIFLIFHLCFCSMSFVSTFFGALHQFLLLLLSNLEPLRHSLNYIIFSSNNHATIHLGLRTFVRAVAFISSTFNFLNIFHSHIS